MATANINYGYMQPFKCACCGKFISTEQIGATKFTPDSYFTTEKVEHLCLSCEAKGEKL